MIIREIRQYIKNELNGVISDKYIRKIQCPSCLKKEAWAYSERPFHIFCPRQNDCGEITKIKDLAPKLFNVVKHYPSTREKPDLPAEMYLLGKGISESVIKKVSFEYMSNIKRGDKGKSMGPAIMWNIQNGIKSGLLMYPPVGEWKLHNVGKIGGRLWGIQYVQDWNNPIYLVDGIIDAMSLMSAGHQAISYLSNPYNQDFSALRGKITKAIIGPNNNNAVRKIVEKIKDSLRDLDSNIEISIALPPESQDWNDMIQRGITEKMMTDCEFRGLLSMAENTLEYVSIYERWTDRLPSIFEMWGRTWYAWKKQVKQSFQTQVDKIGNFVMKLEKTIQTSDEQGREISLWKVKLIRDDGLRRQFEMRGKEIATINRAKETFASLGATAYEPGSNKHHQAFVEYLFKQKAKRVRRMQAFGIDSKTGAFITSRFCVHHGRMSAPHDGHIKIGNEDIEPLDMDNTIKPKKCDPIRIISLMLGAFGERGKVALGWWYGSLFRQDFIERYNFYPFLSCYGEAQTGKSTLALFLSRLRGHDREGFPISKDMTTSKALVRNMSQFSGTPFNIIEGNENVNHAVDMESFLPLFNGGDLFSRANQTNDNATNQDKFKGTIACYWNREQFKSAAMKQRVVSIYFTRKGLEFTKNRFMELQSLKANEICFAGLKMMTYIPIIMQKYQAEYDRCMSLIYGAIEDSRLAEVHAVPATFYNLISAEMGFDDNTLDGDMIKMAVDKKMSLEAIDNSILETFIDVIEEVGQQENSAIFLKWEQKPGFKIYTVWIPGITVTESFKVSKLMPKDVRDALKNSNILIDTSKVTNLNSELRRCVVFKVPD